MTLGVIVLGAGGHARVVADALVAAGRVVLGFVDRDVGKHGTRMMDLPIMGGDEVLGSFATSAVELANGIGSAGVMDARRRIYDEGIAQGFSFVTVVHPSAVIAASATLARGVQVLAGAVVQPMARVGENTIINTGAIVEHDASIGSHTHISPRCVLAGEVQVGSAVHVGVGATVIQRVAIGDSSFVAAGAVVVADVAQGARVMGVPARVQV